MEGTIFIMTNTLILIIILLFVFFHLAGTPAYSKRAEEEQPIKEEEKEKEEKNKNIIDPAGFSTSFNDGEYEYIKDGVRIYANKARDPGVFFETVIRNVSEYKYFVFDIKGKLERLGQWCFPVVQIYDEKDDDYTPSITKTSFTFKENEYTTIVVPLEGKVKNISKIQFMLVTDRGSWDINIINAHFE